MTKEEITCMKSDEFSGMEYIRLQNYMNDLFILEMDVETKLTTFTIQEQKPSFPGACLNKVKTFEFLTL